MNLCNILSLGTVIASLAVPSIASAQRFHGGMGGWRGGSVVRTVPVYNNYVAPNYYPAPAAVPVYNGYTGYAAPVYNGYTGYAAPVYGGGGWERGRAWGGGREGGRGGGGWGRGRR